MVSGASRVEGKADLTSGRYLVWDWNGTLLDDRDLCIESVNAMLARRGLKTIATADEYRAIFRFPVQDYYRALGFEFADGDFPEIAREYISLYQGASGRCGLVRNGLGALERARDLGFTQVLLSASEQRNLERQVGERGLIRFFERVLGTGDVYARSKADVARRWIEKTGIDPARLVFVGDTDHDLEIALSVGAYCVLYSGGHQFVPESPDGSWSVIDDLAELPDILER